MLLRSGEFLWCFVKCNKEELQCSYFQYFLKLFTNLKSRQNDVVKATKMLRSAVTSYLVYFSYTINSMN